MTEKEKYGILIAEVIFISGKKKEPNVVLRDSNIIINRMNHPSCVTEFIRCVNLAIKRKKTALNIICKCERKSIFPDACLPISALIQNYQTIHGVDFNIISNDDMYLKQCHFESPIESTSEKIQEYYKNPFDKIFAYSKDGNIGQVGDLVQAYIDRVSKVDLCEEGVLAGLIWCINEVMDNVLVHSKENTGYVMAQYHKKKKVLAICVYDCGIGIFESLSSGKHKPATEVDALTMAIQEGVGDGKGQGNGLYGLYQIVNENGGKLTITSGKSSIMLRDGLLRKFNNGLLVADGHAGTIVDFQLDLSKKIDIQSALKTLNGFDGFDIRIDDMWQDDDWLKYDVYENCSGTGTRLAGEELRNDVLNIIRKMKAPMVLDFASVKACSSSFIDEFIAKLMVEMGPLEFNKTFKIINMNDFVAHVCERSIFMRMHQSWQELVENTKDVE